MQLVSTKSKTKKRIGRGISSGQGKTAGRGYKGQKSRSGFNIPKRHEGGQTPLSMRLPKLPGFKSKRPKAVVIDFDVISKFFKAGETVSLENLFAKGLIKKTDNKVKVLNNGKLDFKVEIAPNIQISATAKKTIESIKPPKEEKAETEAQAEEKPAPKKTPAKKKAE